MAIHDENGQQDSSKTQEAPQTKPVSMSGFGPNWSLHTNASFGTPIPRSIGNETYLKLKKALLEIFSAASPDIEIALIDLDNVNNTSLAFSCLVVAMRQKNNLNSVAWHALILEATGEKITPVIEQYMGQNVDVQRFTSDAFDNDLKNLALQKLNQAYPKAVFHNTDFTVVPRNFNVDDKTAVYNLTLGISQAVGTEVSVRDKNFVDLNIAHVTKDSNLSMDVTFNSTTIADTVGSPIRSDFQIRTVSTKRQQNDGKRGQDYGLNNGDRDITLAEMSGFIDLVWAPAVPQNPMGFYQNPQMNPQMNQKYVARAVITSLKSYFATTPASVLLALAQSIGLRDNMNWMQSYKPSATPRNEIDLRDIGAINIEANIMNEPNGIGTRIDTKKDSFTIQDLGTLISTVVQPGLLISLDCPVGSPDMYYMSSFSAASNGDRGAYELIMEAADSLTNGLFSQYLENEDLFVDRDNYVHMGTWVDRNGNVRDIRDFDHLAVCNLLGERSPEVIRQWSDTFLRLDIPLQVRLANRKKLIDALSNNTATYTGRAHRITLSGHTIAALARGMAECGFGAKITTPMSAADFSNTRGVATFASQAVIGQGQSFLNVGGFGNANQFNNIFRGATGRFSR